jgi:integrase/recombinase XerD
MNLGTITGPFIAQPLSRSRRPTVTKAPLERPSTHDAQQVGSRREWSPWPAYEAAWRRLGCRLCVSKVANLKTSDIDSKRMLLRVEQGKGMKRRSALKCVLSVARRSWRLDSLALTLERLAFRSRSQE